MITNITSTMESYKKLVKDHQPIRLVIIDNPYMDLHLNLLRIKVCINNRGNQLLLLDKNTTLSKTIEEFKKRIYNMEKIKLKGKQFQLKHGKRIDLKIKINDSKTIDQFKDKDKTVGEFFQNYIQVTVDYELVQINE